MFLHSFPLLILPVALLLSGENGFGEVVALPDTGPSLLGFLPCLGRLDMKDKSRGAPCAPYPPDQHPTPSPAIYRRGAAVPGLPPPFPKSRASGMGKQQQGF